MTSTNNNYPNINSVAPMKRSPRNIRSSSQQSALHSVKNKRHKNTASDAKCAGDGDGDGESNKNKKNGNSTPSPKADDNDNTTEKTPSVPHNYMPHIIIYDCNHNSCSQSVPPSSNTNEELEEDEVYDSDEEPASPIEKTFTVIPQQMNTLQDIIDVGMLFEEPDYKHKTYSVNVAGLYKMIPALREFQEMVGMEDLKKQVVDQVIYLSGKSNHQQFSTKSACTREARSSNREEIASERSLLETLIVGMSKPKTSCKQYRMSESVTDEDNNYDMFHTVIYGPPGVGKTAFAKVLARIFLSLGVTQTDTFRIARRSDLIGEYVGHTATKTQKVIDESMGGVLFIDEIYSLGNGGSKGESKTDSFSTECINTLNQNLTEHKGKFICIIAGYKEETEKYFFGLNPGLRRRFSFYYTIDGYDWEELTKILMFKINKLRHWSAEDGLGEALLAKSFLKDKTEHFRHYAGDIETLLLNTKIAHCKRVFGKQESLQRVITYQDVVDGYARFVAQKGEDVEQRKEQLRMIEHLYC